MPNTAVYDHTYTRQHDTGNPGYGLLYSTVNASAVLADTAALDQGLNIHTVVDVPADDARLLKQGLNAAVVDSRVTITSAVQS